MSCGDVCYSLRHTGNADGLYLHLNVIPLVTLTSRGDQLSVGVLRKNIRPRSKAISVICVLVKSLRLSV